MDFLNKVIIGIVLVVLGACAGSRAVPEGDLKAAYVSEDGKIRFSLTNSTTSDIVFNELPNFFLQQKQNGEWIDLPYIPCECGAPCARPVPMKLAPQESLEFFWDMKSRRCRGREAEEQVFTEGQFRVKVNYQIQEAGIISKSDAIWIEVYL